MNENLELKCGNNAIYIHYAAKFKPSDNVILRQSYHSILN
jgi:hypothetical protein